VFDIGWTEMLVIAVVMILVVGPKDLPGMLRTIGKTVGDLRRMAGDFRRQFSDALKEAEIDDVKKDLTKVTSFSNPLEDINKSVDELMSSTDMDLQADNKIAADIMDTKPVGTQPSGKTKVKSNSGKSVAKPKVAKSSAKTKRVVKTATKTSAGKTAAAKKLAARRKTTSVRKSTPKSTAGSKSA
jgi:sec-independent protein translocase protein TatB